MIIKILIGLMLIVCVVALEWAYNILRNETKDTKEKDKTNQAKE